MLKNQGQPSPPPNDGAVDSKTHSIPCRDSPRGGSDVFRNKAPNPQDGTHSSPPRASSETQKGLSLESTQSSKNIGPPFHHSVHLSSVPQHTTDVTVYSSQSPAVLRAEKVLQLPPAHAIPRLIREPRARAGPSPRGSDREGSMLHSLQTDASLRNSFETLDESGRENVTIERSLRMGAYTEPAPNLFLAVYHPSEFIARTQPSTADLLDGLGLEDCAALLGRLNRVSTAEQDARAAAAGLATSRGHGRPHGQSAAAPQGVNEFASVDSIARVDDAKETTPDSKQHSSTGGSSAGPPPLPPRSGAGGDFAFSAFSLASRTTSSALLSPSTPQQQKQQVIRTSCVEDPLYSLHDGPLVFSGPASVLREGAKWKSVHVEIVRGPPSCVDPLRRSRLVSVIPITHLSMDPGLCVPDFTPHKDMVHQKEKAEKKGRESDEEMDMVLVPFRDSPHRSRPVLSTAESVAFLRFAETDYSPTLAYTVRQVNDYLTAKHAFVTGANNRTSPSLQPREQLEQSDGLFSTNATSSMTTSAPADIGQLSRPSHDTSSDSSPFAVSSTGSVDASGGGAKSLQDRIALMPEEDRVLARSMLPLLDPYRGTAVPTKACTVVWVAAESRTLALRIPSRAAAVYMHLVCQRHLQAASTAEQWAAKTEALSTALPAMHAQALYDYSFAQEIQRQLDPNYNNSSATNPNAPGPATVGAGGDVDLGGLGGGAAGAAASVTGTESTVRDDVTRHRKDKSGVLSMYLCPAQLFTPSPIVQQQQQQPGVVQLTHEAYITSMLSTFHAGITYSHFSCPAFPILHKYLDDPTLPPSHPLFVLKTRTTPDSPLNVLVNKPQSNPPPTSPTSPLPTAPASPPTSPASSSSSPTATLPRHLKIAAEVSALEEDVDLYATAFWALHSPQPYLFRDFYFVLYAGALFSYRDSRATSPTDVIALRHCSIEANLTSLARGEFSFVLRTPLRTLVCRAKHSVALVDWIARIAAISSRLASAPPQYLPDLMREPEAFNASLYACVSGLRQSATESQSGDHSPPPSFSPPAFDRAGSESGSGSGSGTATSRGTNFSQLGPGPTNVAFAGAVDPSRISVRSLMRNVNQAIEDDAGANATTETAVMTFASVARAFGLGCEVVPSTPLPTPDLSAPSMAAPVSSSSDDAASRSVGIVSPCTSGSLGIVGLFSDVDPSHSVLQLVNGYLERRGMLPFTRDFTWWTRMCVGARGMSPVLFRYIVKYSGMDLDKVVPKDLLAALPFKWPFTLSAPYAITLHDFFNPSLVEEGEDVDLSFTTERSVLLGSVAAVMCGFKRAYYVLADFFLGKARQHCRDGDVTDDDRKDSTGTIGPSGILAAEGLTCLQAGAEKGDDMCQYELARTLTSLASAQRSNHNMRLALMWCHRAAEQGNPDALWSTYHYIEQQGPDRWAAVTGGDPERILVQAATVLAAAEPCWYLGRYYARHHSRSQTGSHGNLCSRHSGEVSPHSPSFSPKPSPSPSRSPRDDSSSLSSSSSSSFSALHRPGFACDSPRYWYRMACRTSAVHRWRYAEWVLLGLGGLLVDVEEAKLAFAASVELEPAFELLLDSKNGCLPARIEDPATKMEFKAAYGDACASTACASGWDLDKVVAICIKNGLVNEKSEEFNMMYNCAMLLVSGLGSSDAAKEGTAKVRELLHKCAEAGHVAAMWQLGLLEESRTEDIAEALKYFTKAAEMGSVSAMYSLGLCYASSGARGKEDEQVAMRWYLKACAETDEEVLPPRIGCRVATRNGCSDGGASRKAGDVGVDRLALWESIKPLGVRQAYHARVWGAIARDTRQSLPSKGARRDHQDAKAPTTSTATSAGEAGTAASSVNDEERLSHLADLTNIEAIFAATSPRDRAQLAWKAAELCLAEDRSPTSRALAQRWYRSAAIQCPEYYERLLFDGLSVQSQGGDQSNEPEKSEGQVQGKEQEEHAAWVQECREFAAAAVASDDGLLGPHSARLKWLVGTLHLQGKVELGLDVLGKEKDHESRNSKERALSLFREAVSDPASPSVVAGALNALLCALLNTRGSPLSRADGKGQEDVARAWLERIVSGECGRSAEPWMLWVFGECIQHNSDRSETWRWLRRAEESSPVYSLHEVARRSGLDDVFRELHTGASQQKRWQLLTRMGEGFVSAAEASGVPQAMQIAAQILLLQGSSADTTKAAELLNAVAAAQICWLDSPTALLDPSAARRVVLHCVITPRFAWPALASRPSPLLSAVKQSDILGRFSTMIVSLCPFTSLLTHPAAYRILWTFLKGRMNKPLTKKTAFPVMDFNSPSTLSLPYFSSLMPARGSAVSARLKPVGVPLLVPSETRKRSGSDPKSGAGSPIDTDPETDSVTTSSSTSSSTSSIAPGPPTGPSTASTRTATGTSAISPVLTIAALTSSEPNTVLRSPGTLPQHAKGGMLGVTSPVSAASATSVGAAPSPTAPGAASASGGAQARATNGNVVSSGRGACGGDASVLNTSSSSQYVLTPVIPNLVRDLQFFVHYREFVAKAQEDPNPLSLAAYLMTEYLDSSFSLEENVNSNAGQSRLWSNAPSAPRKRIGAATAATVTTAVAAMSHPRIVQGIPEAMLDYISFVLCAMAKFGAVSPPSRHHDYYRAREAGPRLSIRNGQAHLTFTATSQLPEGVTWPSTCLSHPLALGSMVRRDARPEKGSLAEHHQRIVWEVYSALPALLASLFAPVAQIVYARLENEFRIFKSTSEFLVLNPITYTALAPPNGGADLLQKDPVVEPPPSLADHASRVAQGAPQQPIVSPTGFGFLSKVTNFVGALVRGPNKETSSSSATSASSMMASTAATASTETDTAPGTQLMESASKSSGPTALQRNNSSSSSNNNGNGNAEAVAGVDMTRVASVSNATVMTSALPQYGVGTLLSGPGIFSSGLAVALLMPPSRKLPTSAVDPAATLAGPKVPEMLARTEQKTSVEGLRNRQSLVDKVVPPFTYNPLQMSELMGNELKPREVPLFPKGARLQFIVRDHDSQMCVTFDFAKIILAQQQPKRVMSPQPPSSPTAVNPANPVPQSSPSSKGDSQDEYVSDALPATPIAFTIGREKSSGLLLNDGRVSRSHGRVEFCATYCKYIDQGSSCGSKLNGRSILTANLRNCDVLELGYSTLVFMVASSEKSSEYPEFARVTGLSEGSK